MPRPDVYEPVMDSAKKTRRAGGLGSDQLDGYVEGARKYVDRLRGAHGTGSGECGGKALFRGGLGGFGGDFMQARRSLEREHFLAEWPA